MSTTNRPEMAVKAPTARKDYDFDWVEWLPTGDTIASAVVTAESGITVYSTATTSTVVKVWLTGGTDGSDYVITCTITTANSPARIEPRAMIVPVRAV